MLILVGVSISIAINGGLFDITKRASKETQKEINAEQQLSSGRIKIDEIWYDSLEDYINGKASENQEEGGGENSPDRKDLKVGDYVLYEPDVVSTSYSLNEYGKGEFSQETLTWQVLKVHNNGSIDIIGSPTREKIYFEGILDYNNGVLLLNDICNKLYSKTLEDDTKIEARSVKLEDFEDEENGGKWREVRDAYTYEGVQYGETKTYKGSNSYYPNLYSRENGSGIGTDQVKTDGIGVSDKYYTAPTEETYSPQEEPASDNSLKVTQTFYSIDINETNYGNASKALRVYDEKNAYWVASRFVCHEESEGGLERMANFGIHNVSSLRFGRALNTFSLKSVRF